jgi:hypothetical protein
MRSLGRELRGLRDEVIPAPPGLAEAVVANLGVQDALIPSRSKIVYRGAKRVAGAAVAALTGVLVATGVVKWRSRAIG